MNIIFTAAGRGTRFPGHNKPFYSVRGKTLLEWSTGSLKLPGAYWIIGSVNWTIDEYDACWAMSRRLDLNAKTIFVDGAPGQAAHALRLAEKLDQNTPLIICNCDQYTPWDYKKFQKFIDKNDYDGIVTTYPHGDFEVGKPSKYSHIRFENGRAVELAEKLAISEHSLNGIFYFKRCADFVKGTQRLISDTKSGEIYVSLVYNYLISDGKKVGMYPMGIGEFVSLGSLKEVNKNLEKLS